MNEETKSPETLLEAVRYFSNPEVSLNFMISLRWPDGVTCPACESKNVTLLSTRQIWKCKACKKQFSIKSGTLLEDSAIKLDKWLVAIWLIASAKNGISSYEIHRSLGITQKSAWFMLHRIRLAMQTGTFTKLSGQVEADETFIGGKARNMHAKRRKEVIQGRGAVGKTIVMGLLERGGEVRTSVVDERNRMTLQKEVLSNVAAGSELFTDELASYTGLNSDYAHQVINHAECYVKGQVHTNGIENFWSLLKRGLKGTYISVEPFHLFRYLDEQVFRFNSRKSKDGDRFLLATKYLVGKRLTYKQLTGNQKATP